MFVNTLRALSSVKDLHLGICKHYVSKQACLASLGHAASPDSGVLQHLTAKAYFVSGR